MKVSASVVGGIGKKQYECLDNLEYLGSSESDISVLHWKLLIFP